MIETTGALRLRPPWRLAAVALLWAGVGCLAPVAPPALQAARGPSNVRELPSRPRVAVVVRDGDARAAIAVAVLTRGVDDAAGPRLPVALAAVIEARLAGLHDVTVAPTWDGYRIRALVPKDGDGATVVRALRDALLAKVTASELAAAERRLAALARRPLRDPALEEAARCGEVPSAIGPKDVAAPSVETLEQWRAASHGLGRVVFGVTGTSPEVDAVTSAMLEQAAWPEAAPFSRAPASAPPAPVRVYDATGDLAGAAARVTVVVHTPDASAATAAARALGSRSGALAGRLHALDAPVTLRDVTATAQATGGCLAVAFDVGHADGRADDSLATLASAVALVRQEAHLSVLSPSRRRGAERDAGPAASAGDPREAAELAAWWALVPATGEGGDASDSVVIGVAGDPTADIAARAKGVTSLLERAETAWQTPVVDARRDAERGQRAMSILLASPCGVGSEGEADAGLSALAIASLVEQARRSGAPDVELSEWVSSDGVGLLARVPRSDQETPAELSERAADLVGAALTEAVDAAAIERARAELLGLAAQDDGRGFATLAEVLAPGHPSWTLPWIAGPGGVAARGLEAWSDGAVLSRLAGLRREPLRVAVLGDEDAKEADAAVLALDRWLPRGALRACPAASTAEPVKPGTYAAPGPRSAAWLAIPLPRGATRGVHDAAIATAAALDGPGGLLAQSLSSGLASAWSARVVGPADRAALVVHVTSPGLTLDAAVAQVRALLDRVHRGALTEADHARAAARIAEKDLAAGLSPRGRLERLWRGEPKVSPVTPLDAMRSFAEATLRDETLVIVAERPPTSKGAP